MRQQQRLDSFGTQSTKFGEFESIFVDEDSVPFGHYQLTRLQEFVYKLFQFRVLPRGFLFKAVHRSIVRRRGCLTNDVSIHGIRLRMQAEGNACEKSFLVKASISITRIFRRSLAPAKLMTNQYSLTLELTWDCTLFC